MFQTSPMNWFIYLIYFVFMIICMLKSFFLKNCFISNKLKYNIMKMK